MSDDILRSLAGKSGVETTWRSTNGDEHAVSIDTLRSILTAIGLPCATDDDARNSLSIAEFGSAVTANSRFLTARVGQTFVLPHTSGGASSVEVELENGSMRSVTPMSVSDGLMTLPGFDTPGYHRVRIADAEFTVAAAPERCVVLGDLTAGNQAWGLSAQIYSLRRPGDGGVGDFGSARDLAVAAAARGADMLALSPVHALFAAEPRHVSPYSPSSRLFYNPVHADPRVVFPEDLVSHAAAGAGLDDEMRHLETLARVDWPNAARIRLKILRSLYDTLIVDAHAGEGYKHDFHHFRSNASDLLVDHCTFEALHAWHLAQETPVWAWWDWEAGYRDPNNHAVHEFRAQHQLEVDFHLFLQWITTRSYADCQRICRDSGMRVGLIADLAIGMDATGSHAWSRQHEVLGGVSIGAPPDFFNADGQNWGLTGFSPRGLAASGFQPFIETLRAAMRYAGGIRIDHVMGMSRLWLVPRGASASEGAYLHYPSETLFRLIALESWRHKAVVIGEDLGTLPDGFRDYLRDQGVGGLRVLRFERNDYGFRGPDEWDWAAASLTTTHDLIPTAGWWAGTDIERGEGELSDFAHPESIRSWDRGLLWSALERAGVAHGERPSPEDTDPVVDAAIAFVAKTPCRAKLIAIEDIVGTRDQPNVPGTTGSENWSHRLDGDAADLLGSDKAMHRIRSLGGREPEQKSQAAE
jgi:4-alpha-glucanotransferase